jgi:hypothetical protein
MAPDNKEVAMLRDWKPRSSPATVVAIVALRGTAGHATA